MTISSLLNNAIPRWKTLPKTSATPRRAIRLDDWQADWNANIALLTRYCRAEHDDSSVLQGHAALEYVWQWKAAAEAGSNLLLKGIDRGFDGQVLRQLYIEVVELWLHQAQLLNHAHNSLQQQNIELTTGALLTPRSREEYPFALQLLAMGVLLNEQEQLPALVEHVLHFDTDRLLDYLTAPALGLTEAADAIFHPRPFSTLFAALNDNPVFTPANLSGYLQTQYREFFQMSPKAAKKTKRLIGPDCWGYWAMEVSALTVLYGGDDTELRSNPHYLADLVDFSRK